VSKLIETQFRALMDRVAASELTREDKAALLLALGYANTCMYAAVTKQDRMFATLYASYIAEAQELLGKLARAMEEVKS